MMPQVHTNYQLRRDLLNDHHAYQNRFGTIVEGIMSFINVSEIRNAMHN